MVARSAAAEAGGDTRERILVAALEAFSDQGFDGATTRDIAAQAGVPLGLLQYHFGSKDKLWRAAVERAFAELRSGLESIVAESGAVDERQRMRRLIRAHVHFVSANPQFIRIMHDEGKRRGPRMRWLVDRFVKPLFDMVLPQIRRAQEQGILPDGIPPFHFVYILVGAGGLIFHQSEECKRVTGIDPFDADATEAHARAVEHLFLGPPEETTP